MAARWTAQVCASAAAILILAGGWSMQAQQAERRSELRRLVAQVRDTVALLAGGEHTLSSHVAPAASACSTCSGVASFVPRHLGNLLHPKNQPLRP